MLNKLKKTNNEKGFTIIEVMVVLAIAGLIMLIIFLAVPALQRNSRNTNRKEDVGRISSATTSSISNSNGNIATAVTDAKVQAEVGNLGYYVSTNITTTVLSSGGKATNQSNIDTVLVVGNGKCDPNGTDAVYAARQIAVLYSTEGGGAKPTPVCIDQ